MEGIWWRNLESGIDMSEVTMSSVMGGGGGMVVELGEVLKQQTEVRIFGLG